MAHVKAGYHLLEGTASISGTVFIDSDRDAVRDEDEKSVCSTNATYPMGNYLNFWRDVPGLGLLYLNGTFTCDYGKYRIGELPGGEYVLGFMFACSDPLDQNGNYQPPTQRITLTEGMAADNVDLAACALAPPPPPVSTPLPPVPPESTSVPTDIISAPSTGDGGPSSTSDQSISFALAFVGAFGAVALAFALRRRARRR